MLYSSVLICRISIKCSPNHESTSNCHHRFWHRLQEACRNKPSRKFQQPNKRLRTTRRSRKSLHSETALCKVLTSITASRALRIDCWPMSGFDNPLVDQEFLLPPHLDQMSFVTLATEMWAECSSAYQGIGLMTFARLPVFGLLSLTKAKQK